MQLTRKVKVTAKFLTVMQHSSDSQGLFYDEQLEHHLREASITMHLLLFLYLYYHICKCLGIGCNTFKIGHHALVIYIICIYVTSITKISSKSCFTYSSQKHCQKMLLKWHWVQRCYLMHYSCTHTCTLPLHRLADCSSQTASCSLRFCMAQACIP